jgi:symplekin
LLIVLLYRTDLALEWLHEEYLFDKRNQRLDTEYASKYFYWFHQLLKKGIPTLDAKDRILTKLLLDAPEINAETINMIKENLHSVPERFVSCVSTLRSLVTNRPTVRFLALQVLLDLCTNENDKIRRTSIVAVKKWNANQNDINTRVEEFSVEALNVLTTEKDVDMNNPTTEAAEEAVEKPAEQDVTMDSNDDAKAEKKEEEITKEDPNAWTEKDVVRHAELYFVLCTKRPSLLKE